VAKAQQLGLLNVDKRIYPTEKGQQYLNELLALFLTE
jgi:oxygen-independent coproporphyrinogen-3 oxidase